MEELKEKFEQLQKSKQEQLYTRTSVRQSVNVNSSSKKQPSASHPSHLEDEEEPPMPDAFGVDDDLQLSSIVTSQVPAGVYEDINGHLNDEIRELRDENGRLYKLLNERDYEIKSLRRKLEDEKLALAGSGVGSDTAAARIIELSKKNREATAQLEIERSKTQQINKKYIELEKQMARSSNHPLNASKNNEELEKCQHETSQLKEKLTQMSTKLAEYKTQCDCQKQEMKKITKALEREVGEGVSVQAILSGQSNWRGRQQQIISLQTKLNELKESNDRDFDRNSSVSRTVETEIMAKSRRLEEQHRDEVRKIERERREALERSGEAQKVLEMENTSFKQKLEASKARNTVLNNELKAVKQQVTTLLEKGKHDDELIEALMKQQGQMKQLLDDMNRKEHNAIEHHEKKMRDLERKKLEETSSMEQMKMIMQQKEERIRQLENELHSAPLRQFDDQQFGRLTSLFDGAGSTTSMLNPVPEEAGMQYRQASPMRKLPESRPQSIDSLSRPSSSRLSNRPPSVGKPKAGSIEQQRQHLPSSYEHSQQNMEIETILRATEAERDRLIELVRVLQKRNDDALNKMLTSENVIHDHRRRAAALEKQLERLKLEAASSSGANKGAGNAKKRTKPGQPADVSNDPSILQIRVEELETSLAIQRDENDALKSALESVLAAKEDDLKSYTAMMETNRKHFMDGLKAAKKGK